MTVDGRADAAPRGHAGRAVRRARRSWRRALLVVGVAVVAGVGVIAVAGGFADVPDARQPRYAVGETFENELYRIAFRSIEVTEEHPFSGIDLDGETVVVRAEVTVLGDEALRTAYNWLRPLEVDLADDGGFLVSARDGSTDPPLQPGVPADVYYAWRLAEGVPADGVEIGIFERYLDLTNPIDGATTGPALVGIVQEEP